MAAGAGRAWIRLAALDRVLADADDRFGAVAEELVSRAEAELVAPKETKNDDDVDALSAL